MHVHKYSHAMILLSPFFLKRVGLLAGQSIRSKVLYSKRQVDIEEHSDRSFNIIACISAFCVLQ